MYLQSHGIAFRYPIEVLALFQSSSSPLPSVVPSRHVPLRSQCLPSSFSPPFITHAGTRLSPGKIHPPRSVYPAIHQQQPPISRPQRPRPYRDGFAWLVRCPCSSGCARQILPEPALLAGCREVRFGSGRTRRASQDACSNPRFTGTWCECYSSVQGYVLPPRRTLTAGSVSTSRRRDMMEGLGLIICSIRYSKALVRCKSRWVDDSVSRASRRRK